MNIRGFIDVYILFKSCPIETTVTNNIGITGGRENPDILYNAFGKRPLPVCK
jgi:hypothetical protein